MDKFEEVLRGMRTLQIAKATTEFMEEMGYLPALSDNRCGEVIAALGYIIDNQIKELRPKEARRIARALAELFIETAEGEDYYG